MSRLSSTGRRGTYSSAPPRSTPSLPRYLSRGARLLARGAARVTYRSTSLATGALVETLRSSGDVPRDKLLVIDNGVDLEPFQVDKPR